jgi:hypothetical protein
MMENVAKPLSLHQLPLLPKRRVVREFSSHNRMGYNMDCGNYLYIDSNGDAVIFDAAGPGCIRNIWVTGVLQPACFKFYFDDDKIPRYEIDIEDFFSGQHSDFKPPLVSLECRGYHLGANSQAGNCFVPIPFKDSLKIAVSGNHDFFYHFIWEQYPYGTPIDTFPDNGSIEHFTKFWNQPDYIRYSGVAGKENNISVDVLPSQEKVDIYNQQGSGYIGRIVIEAPCADILLKEVYLCMHWDNTPYKQVQAPIGAFFGVPLGATPIHSLPILVEPLPNDQIRLTCYWPMPYWKNAHIFLDNRSNVSIPQINAIIEVFPQSFAEEECGYFTTLYRNGQTEHGRDWLFFESPGWGQFAGVVQTMFGGHYCEGDEHFYIDGACSPQLNGTGSEDYYLACFWPNKKFDTPFAGCAYDVHLKGGGLKENAYLFPAAYYRFHLEAPIPFYRSIDARIQHGGMSNIISHYTSLAFCYLKKKSVLVQTDYIDINNKLSEAMHKYSASSCTSIDYTTSSCEGNYFDSVETLNGYRHDGGIIRFKVAIHPNNQGVRLRRRLDQKYGRQKARVWVDDEYVGVWYDAKLNEWLRWYDSDFELPSIVTKGKSVIEISLEVLTDDGLGTFTDFSYRVYCYQF